MTGLRIGRRSHAYSGALPAFALGLATALAPASLRADEAPRIETFIGKFGLASWFREADAPAVAKAARAQCGAPYVVARGPGGGVMLHLPDTPTTSEHVLKAAGGKTYLGPAADPAGGKRDREVVEADAAGFTLRWVDPSVGSRYGVMVFRRCGR